MGVQGLPLLGVILFCVTWSNVFVEGRAVKGSGLTGVTPTSAPVEKKSFVITGLLSPTSSPDAVGSDKKKKKKRGRSSKALHACGTCNCDSSASSAPELVCGTDGITYPDACTLNCLSNCYWKGHLLIKHPGECDPVDSQLSARAGMISDEEASSEGRPHPTMFRNAQTVFGKNLFLNPGGTPGGLSFGGIGMGGIQGGLNRGYGQYSDYSEDGYAYHGDGYDEFDNEGYQTFKNNGGGNNRGPGNKYTRNPNKHRGPGDKEKEKEKHKGPNDKEKEKHKGPNDKEKEKEKHRGPGDKNKDKHKGPGNKRIPYAKGPTSVGDGFALFCYDCAIYLQNQAGSGGVQEIEEENKYLI